MSGKKRAVKEIKPYSPRWEELANQLARSFAPDIFPCKTCKRPVVSGYCCQSCGETDPGRPDPNLI